MICTLAEVKTRLEISVATWDAMLTQMITAVGARFDAFTGRRLEYEAQHAQVFPAFMTSLCADAYPMGAVAKWEVLESVAEGWVEVTAPGYLAGPTSPVLQLDKPLGSDGDLLRLTYPGGYLFPGSSPPAPPAWQPSTLPEALHYAAIEQVAQWYQLKGSAGVSRVENISGVYWTLADSLLVPWVRLVLKQYRRMGVI